MNNIITPEQILQYCLENLEGTVLTESWGEKVSVRSYGI